MDNIHKDFIGFLKTNTCYQRAKQYSMYTSAGTASDRISAQEVWVNLVQPTPTQKRTKIFFTKSTYQTDSFGTVIQKATK